MILIMLFRSRNRKGASRIRKADAKGAKFYHRYLREGKDLRPDSYRDRKVK